MISFYSNQRDCFSMKMIYYRYRNSITDVRQSYDGSIYTLQHRLYIEADFDKPICNYIIICIERRPKLHANNGIIWRHRFSMLCDYLLIILNHWGRVILMHHWKGPSLDQIRLVSWSAPSLYINLCCLIWVKFRWYLKEQQVLIEN